MGTRLVDNLAGYRHHQMLAGALFWMPTTVLYLTERLGLASALAVQAAYYVAVVVLELPSGWFSDRFGRVTTLRLVAACWVAAHLLFATATDVGGLLLAQLLLAAGYASLSGTDVTFHYDTLEALGRAEEFETREASARGSLLLVTAVSALVGGGLGMIDLRLPYLVSAGAAVAQGVVAFRLTEPVGGAHPRPVLGERTEARAVVGHLATPSLAWIALFVAAQVVSVHLVADLAGPYLAAATDATLSNPGAAAFSTGASAAAAALVGAVCVRRVPSLRRRIGSVNTLLGAAAIPVIVLGTMAWVTSVWVLPLLAVRGLPSAAVAVIAPAMVGAQVTRRHRASFLSLASLGGRLVYGALLLALGASAVSLEVSLAVAVVTAAALWLVTAGFQHTAVDGTDLGDAIPAGVHSHRHLHFHWGSHDHRHAGEHDPKWGLHRHPHTHDGPGR